MGKTSWTYSSFDFAEIKGRYSYEISFMVDNIFTYINGIMLLAMVLGLDGNSEIGRICCLSHQFRSRTVTNTIEKKNVG